MINSKTGSIEWINELQDKIGKRSDPKLIEKVIQALIFLEQLKLNGLDFIFKGGTSLLLVSPSPKRFSIDIDVITEESEDKIKKVLDSIVKAGVFLKWEDDNKRKHSADAPLGHFKVFYKSVVDGNEEPILLDLLYSANPYPKTLNYPIQHHWLITADEPTTVMMPTFEAILGDKLTAFAPETTGILYSKNRPVEIIKQLFDIAFLFDHIQDLNTVKESYDKVVLDEIGFRKLQITKDEVLNDTLKACFILAERDAKSAAFKHLQLGIKNFTNFTIDRFKIEEAIIAAAKVAYLITLMKSEENLKIERFKRPLEIKNWMIENPIYNKLNKLKKTNPEAFFYWYRALNK